MRPARYLTLAFLLIALAALVAGCGGGGGDETTDATTTEKTVEEAPSLTKEELIKQGDGICAEVNAAIASVGSSAAEPSSQVTQVANLYTNMVENIQNLGEPRENPAEYTPFMEAAEELAKVEGEAKLAAEREDTVALGEAGTAAAPILEEFQTQAGIYGFEQCSQGPGELPAAPSTGSSEGGEVEEGGVEVEEGVIEEVPPEEEFVPEEEVAPEGGGAGAIEEVVPEGGGEEESSSGGGIGPG